MAAALCGRPVSGRWLALWLRLTDPVRKMISNADDLITWTLTFLPILTGMALLSEPSARSSWRATM